MILDYLVIDFDGKIYPSDEARMLARIGSIDFTIGSLSSGLDFETIAQFNAMQDNQKYSACNECAYQPFCGIDVIDDVSRYGSVDYPKLETHFCQTHMSLFDYIFLKIKERDFEALMNFSGHLTGRFEINPVFSGAYLD